MLNEKNMKEKVRQAIEKLAAIEAKMEKTDEEPSTAAEDEDKKWHYTFLGECYIHGMMDGEAIREFTDKKLCNQVFELR